ncbi:diphosphomevalonate decarboxylase [Anaerolineae bacterium CFX9]|nr:diphosphomevalonate decarboxylase [Anaerolineae bacterium CFX9]
MTDRSATAQAHPNIAFIKYWGNRNDELRLPANSSLSMNLDGLHTETTVIWNETLSEDELILNGQREQGPALERVKKHLDVIRARINLTARASVISANNFPTGAGIASSASAFAALTTAAFAAAGADLGERELTTFARLGSGSAARSIPSGFVRWHAADTHEDSYAESIGGPALWDIVDVIAVVNTGHKSVGSSAGHTSAATSDLQAARVNGAAARLIHVEEAILRHDFEAFAHLVELDSNLMHAVMMTSNPSLFYWQPASLMIMQEVRSWRSAGLPVCYTLDAGPNVHCICERNAAARVSDLLHSMSEVRTVYTAPVGGGARVISASE